MSVNVQRIHTGVAAASTLLAATGAGALGCAEETLTDEDVGVADDELNPGSAQLVLTGYPGYYQIQLTSSTTDEFVRVGESIKFRLPAWLMWEILYPNQPLPTDAKLKKLKATVKTTWFDKAKALSTKTFTTTTSWTGSQYSLEVMTGAGKVVTKTDSFQMAITITDSANTSASASIPASQIQAVQVFGGELPNKSLLFDQTNGTLRQRVVDGDLLVKGSAVTLGYSDWRADQIVDKMMLDTQIGVATTSGRGGSYQAPIYGQLTYQVMYGYSTDGGKTFGPEKSMSPNTASRFLGANRTAYESVENIPSTSTNVQFYFHIKAILTADYSGYWNITSKWYADNQQILLKERWDNPNGSGTNYTFQLQ